VRANAQATRVNRLFKQDRPLVDGGIKPLAQRVKQGTSGIIVALIGNIPRMCSLCGGPYLCIARYDTARPQDGSRSSNAKSYGIIGIELREEIAGGTNCGHPRTK
jgi:hypothetical protein